MGRGLVALVLLLALNGCAVVTAPPPGLSDGERAVLQQRMRDAYWQMTQLPDDQRPQDPEMVRVDGDEQTSLFVRCMNDAGYDNYAVEADGYSYTWTAVGQRDDAALAEYVCHVSMWPDIENGFFNAAQISYLYDYYRDVLVPCLRTHGVDFVQLPTRAQFDEGEGQWNPYFSVTDGSVAKISDTSILASCPATPSGIPDRGITAAISRLAEQQE